MNVTISMGNIVPTCINKRTQNNKILVKSVIFLLKNVVTLTQKCTTSLESTGIWLYITILSVTRFHNLGTIYIFNGKIPRKKT